MARYKVYVHPTARNDYDDMELKLGSTFRGILRRFAATVSSTHKAGILNQTFPLVKPSKGVYLAKNVARHDIYFYVTRRKIWIVGVTPLP